MALADWALSEQEVRPDRTTGARGRSSTEPARGDYRSLEAQELHDPARGARIYRIMQMTYAQEQAVDQILRTLHISRRQYFYDLKDSIEIYRYARSESLWIKEFGREQRTVRADE